MTIALFSVDVYICVCVGSCSCDSVCGFVSNPMIESIFSKEDEDSDFDVSDEMGEFDWSNDSWESDSSMELIRRKPLHVLSTDDDD